MSKTRKADDPDSICAGRWASRVKDADDGEIEINVDDDGKIGGTHHKKKKPIAGKCDDKPQDHRISFVVKTDDGCKYTYKGVIGFFRIPGVPPFFGIIGKVNKKCPNQLLAPGDDDWVGTKGT